MERALIVLLVGLLSAFFVDANQQRLEGPGGLKAYVNRTGGSITQLREMPAGPGQKGPRKSKPIEIRLGKIREYNGTDSSGQPILPPPGRKKQLERPENITFNVEDRKYVILTDRINGNVFGRVRP